MTVAAQREKVVILGGGMAALTVALELTEPPDWRERLDVTVYQIGWRLGGKGASGRGQYGRIQEHGLHIWMGFYENAFRVIRQVYDELGRPPDVPLATWDAAFKPHSLVGVMEHIDGDWKPWLIDFPRLPGSPGDQGVLPELWELIVRALEGLRDWIERELGLHEAKLSGAAATVPSMPDWLGTALGDATGAFRDVEQAVEQGGLHAAAALARRMPAQPHSHVSAHHRGIIWFIEQAIEWLERELERAAEDVEDLSDTLRRLITVVDLTAACLRDIVESGALTDPDGLTILDEMDFQEFLKTHGARPSSYDITQSAAVRGFYDLVFGYRDGDTSRPSFAAGAALRTAMSILLAYSGAVFWKMQAGMGDTIFAPTHQVLKRRGVRFEFFHRVDDVILGDRDGQPTVSRIEIGRQVDLIGDDYDPLVDVEALPCWPQAPLVEQIVQGEKLLQGPTGSGTDGWEGDWQGFNLESFWTTWPDAGRRTLELGRDFDTVVFSISLASIPYICSGIVERHEQWRDMVERVETVRTQALQLWLGPDLDGLGWTRPSPVVDAYVQPFNTWADMSQLTVREAWPQGHDPGSIAYFCGPMLGGIPDRSDHGAPARARDEVEVAARTWIGAALGRFWPKAVGGDGTFDWALLVDPSGRNGEARLASQFWRANLDPSERYVLSVAGSTRYRLKAGDTGVDNLVICGDWIDNGFNAGCIEAAVMSGMQAANEIAPSARAAEIARHFGL